MIPAAENAYDKEITIRHSTDGFSYIVFDNNRNTFVPAAVFQDNNKKKYLEILGLADKDSVVLCDYIESADAYNVYAISRQDYEETQSQPEDVKPRHASSLLIANLIKENQQRTDIARVYLKIKNQSYEMIVLKGANLLFHNNFRFKTKEDFLYFLLFSLEQLHLEPESVPVYFFGMIEEDSKLVELTSRYVRDIRFRKNNIFSSECES